MVAPVDNLTRLSGALVERRPHPGLAGWEIAVLEVDAAEPVTGRADLLSRRRGERVEVAVRAEVLADAPVGSRVSCRARVTPSGVMAEAHPAAGSATVTRP